MIQMLTNRNIDFLRWRWYALALSLAVVVAGAGLKASRGLPLGIDFSGGTILIVGFAEPVTEDAVRGALAPVPGEKVVQQYGERRGREMLIRLPLQEEEEAGASLEQGARAVMAALEASAEIGAFEVLSTEIVGPVIGADLQRKGIYATLSALFGIMVYIALRFNFAFGVGAIVAGLHDIFVTVALLNFFGYELSLNVVAAILAITGYSVNDTIVIFDRVRENLRTMRRDALEDVINRSINQTLGRTVITSGTTIMAVLALFLFGGQALRGFSFTMLVGVIAGTYSTIFIAGSIALAMTRRRQAARARAVAPAAAPAKKAVPRTRVS